MPQPYLELKRKMLGVVTQAEIARIHGCRPEHVNMVLQGRRRSKRILRLINEVIAERESLEPAK